MLRRICNFCGRVIGPDEKPYRVTILDANYADGDIEGDTPIWDHADEDICVDCAEKIADFINAFKGGELPKPEPRQQDQEKEPEPEPEPASEPDPEKPARKRSKIDKEAVKEMLEEGKSRDEIAETLGVTKQNLSKFISNHNLSHQSKINMDEIRAYIKAGWSTEKIANEKHIRIDRMRRLIEQAKTDIIEV